MDKTISIIGLGYVGLPLAVAFSKHLKVIGFDKNPERIEELKKGIDRTREISKEELDNSPLTLTANPDELKEASIHIVAVPTPVDYSRTPDLRALKGASSLVGELLKKGDIVVYESTVFPGATEDVCQPLLEESSGLKAGEDFFLGYSPERINPGDKNHTLSKIVKVVSGQNQETLDTLSELYGLVVEAGIHKASSIKVAEAAKVIENIQRDVNIALMNELSIIFEKLDIDTNDVLDAAKTKWNFLPFTPGLVGGHCIGVDPYYLTYKAATIGYNPQMILSGRKINDEMGRRIARRVIKHMTRSGLSVGNKTITILGFTFKENVPDIRNTKVVDIVRELESFGVNVQIIDPECDKQEVLEEFGIELTDPNRAIKSDSLILAVPHQKIKSGGWEYVQSFLTEDKTTKIVFDVKGVLPRGNTKPENCLLVRL